MFLSSDDIQLGRGETIEDTARVLSRMVDGIMIRTFKQSDVEMLAQFGEIPVINALTDDYHPCQILADLLTYYEYKGNFSGKVCYIGDGNNVANSLMIGCAKMGLDFSIATPAGYEVPAGITDKCLEVAKHSGSAITCTHSPVDAIVGADCVYTDVWASMGQESEAAAKYMFFEGFEIDKRLMLFAKHDAIFMHCLPAHRGEEVSAEVIDGSNSVIFDQAENRLHAQKALMVLLMGNKNG